MRVIFIEQHNNITGSTDNLYLWGCMHPFHAEIYEKITRALLNVCVTVFINHMALPKYINVLGSLYFCYCLQLSISEDVTFFLAHIERKICRFVLTP